LSALVTVIATGSVATSSASYKHDIGAEPRVGHRGFHAVLGLAQNAGAFAPGIGRWQGDLGDTGPQVQRLAQADGRTATSGKHRVGPRVLKMRQGLFGDIGGRVHRCLAEDPAGHRAKRFGQFETQIRLMGCGQDQDALAPGCDRMLPDAMAQARAEGDGLVSRELVGVQHGAGFLRVEAHVASPISHLDRILGSLHNSML
jgi:hypothetical protein